MPFARSHVEDSFAEVVVAVGSDWEQDQAVATLAWDGMVGYVHSVSVRAIGKSLTHRFHRR